MAAVIQPISAVGMLGLYSMPIPPFFVEGTSQSWIAGNPLILASGVVTVAGTDPQALLIGIAMAKASGTAGTAVDFVPFLPNIIFEISVDGAAVGGAAPGTGHLAQSNVGTQYGITVDSTSGSWYLDTSKTTIGTNTVLTLIGFQTQPNSTANYSAVVNGRALVHFNQMSIDSSNKAYPLTIWY